MGIITAIVVGVVVAGAAIYGAVAAKSAANKAERANRAALDKVKGINPHAATSTAKAGDIDRFKDSLEAQRKYDPTLAKIREEGAQSVLDELRKGDNQSQQLLNKLYNENINEDPGITQLRQEMIRQANQELSEGAKLSPDIQAEMIKAGLERAKSSGLSTDPTSNTGGDIKEVIGTAGLQIQRDRQEAASKLGTSAQQLQATRASILAGLVSTVENASTQRQARAVNAFDFANKSIPAIGLGGADLVNLMLRNQEIQNGKALREGEISAQAARDDGAYRAGIASGVASGVTAGVGAYGGAGGSMSGGKTYSAQSNITGGTENGYGGTQASATYQKY